VNRQTGASHIRTAKAITIIGCVAAVLFGVSHIGYLSFLCDDAFISFRCADHLASGQGAVFNPGERVESYTNFLWVVILAGGRWVGIPPDALAAPLGASIAILTLAGLAVHLVRRGKNPVPFVFLIAGCSAWAAWSTGGLETSLFTSLVTLAFFATLTETGPRQAGRRLALSSVLLLLATLTRPDGLLIAASIGLFLLPQVVGKTITLRALLAWAAGWCVPLGLYLLWRHSYYLHWWPSPAGLKMPGLEMLSSGLAYLKDALLRLHLYMPLAVLVVHVARFRGRALRQERTLLAAALVIPYLTFVALAGGDFMDQFRLVLPVLPALFWVVSASSLELWAGAGMGLRGGLLALLVIWLGLNGLGSHHSVEPWYEGNVDSVGRMRELTSDWSAIGRHLRSVSQPSDSVAVTAAGCIPYYSGLYTIDQLGLTTYDLSSYTERDVRRPGHNRLLRGDALMKQRPQFVLGGPIAGGTPAEARFGSWVDESGQAALEREYTPVVALADSPRGPRFYKMAVRRDVVARFP
jgi:arabinofuranosyltransferase